MSWIKKGLIYAPNHSRSWEHSHAHVVCVDQIDAQTLRLLFSVRNKENQCLPTFVDIDATTFKVKSALTEAPIFPLGDRGAFDDCGIMPTWLYKENGTRYLYYIGWTVRNTIPYHNSLGLAISKDGLTYEKAYEGPILAASKEEPYFVGSACVMKIDSNFVAWYLSCVGWELVDDKPEPLYDLKIATSSNGYDWKRTGITAIPLKAGEGGVSRPSVLFEDGIYKMWYSYRGRKQYRTFSEASYRIGYAESKDGFHWVRMDDAVGISLSKDGWDSEMMEYPLVFELFNKKIMIYNGNGFGKTGFGYAIWEDA